MSAIILDNIYKHYHFYSNDYQRLHEIITGRSKAKVIKALEPVSMHIEKGEVVGIIGNNGAGKSTLLKLVSGTTTPSGGTREVNGRIAALLELGAGFHPELTGHENVYLSGSILGISKAQMDKLYDEIVAFSGIGDFIHQPVKTYSSGMFVRLAFSVATSVEPDILIIDEALSVGDGRFARKSFDRIMQFKEQGKTILFCSHAMFQIESICDRAIWINQGEVKMDGKPAAVVVAYNASIKTPQSDFSHPEEHKTKPRDADEKNELEIASDKYANDADHETQLATLKQVKVLIDNKPKDPLIIQSGQSTLTIRAEFESDPSIKEPSFGVTISDENDYFISSACTLVDDYVISRNEQGHSQIEITFPSINLLKGKYSINVYLMCEQCILIYDQVLNFAEFEVKQATQELGYVRLPHTWK